MKLILLISFFIINLTFAELPSPPQPDIDCNEMVTTTGKHYHEIYAAHESNCNSFYQCTDHGLVELKCLRGLVFFPYINGCVERTPDNCITWSRWRQLKHI